MAAGTTYEPITTHTLSSNQGTLSFNSFSGYTDLRIVMSLKITGGGLTIKPNSNSSSIYSGTYLRGNGSAGSSIGLTTGDLGSSGLYLFNGAVSNSNFHTVILDFLNYTNTTTFKTMLAKFYNVDNFVGISAGLAQTTAAITSIDFACDGGGQLSSGSTFNFYGITAA